MQPSGSSGYPEGSKQRGLVVRHIVHTDPLAVFSGSFHMLRSLHAWAISFCIASCFAAAADTHAGEVPTDLQPIGGHWFLKNTHRSDKASSDRPIYFYRDGEQFVDLFSYHTKDSNQDGIDNLRLSHDENFLIIESQGYPNHPTAIFPNSGNPNSIRVQSFKFRLPLRPKLAESITRLPRGPIGMALNGVVFFNPFEMEGQNAVAGYSEVWLDSCCGHPQQTGVYHYHKYPTCVKSPFRENGKQHSPIIGFAWDGFPVYGPFESAGVKAMDLQGQQALDVCNGHTDELRGYHYHVTPGRFPYILGGYAGVVETSNSRDLRRPQQGAIEDNTQPGTRMEDVLVSVRPGTASRGKTHQIQLVLKPENARRRIPDGVPSWVQVGPYEAAKITRQGNLVTADLTIPDDAAVDILLDVHIEFGGNRNPLAYKRNDAFRVVE